jgi:hypothetical protein
LEIKPFEVRPNYPIINHFVEVVLALAFVLKNVGDLLEYFLFLNWKTMQLKPSHIYGGKLIFKIDYISPVILTLLLYMIDSFTQAGDEVALQGKPDN